MELSIAVGALTFYPLSTTFAIARDAGVNRVEVLLTRRMIASGGQSITSQARAAGVSVVSAHAELSMGGESLAGKIAADVRSIQTAAAIDDCRSIVLHMPCTPSGQAAPVLHWLDVVTATRDKARSDLDLALENRAENWDGTPGQWLDDVSRLMAIAGEWGARICLDLAHAVSFELDLLETTAIVRPLLVNVHLSDARRRQYHGGLLNGLFRDHALPGDGVLPIGDVLRSLANSGYTGPVTLELSPVSLRAWWPRAARRRLRAATGQLRGQIETQSTGSETPVSGPGRIA